MKYIHIRKQTNVSLCVCTEGVVRNVQRIKLISWITFIGWAYCDVMRGVLATRPFGNGIQWHSHRPHQKALYWRYFVVFCFFFLVPALVMHSALPRDHWITIISTAVLINTVICHSCLYDFFLFAFALLFFSSSRVSLSFYVMSTALNPISRTLWAAHTHNDGTAALLEYTAHGHACLLPSHNFYFFFV